ncbi:isochorismate synthase [Basfia succiniciproducens]|uniref:Isochorismate synthase MenF n=1 Tax=Basfia succiniciproducens TaxID=653940 RepID=A0A1G5EKC5_9PAST|nr:isochorismate synthase [Basfia succiniciproducens]QIM69082.1 isochorismate synthase [Basfia succiniciproducens]SCY27453.1 isochorismate synthase [Basfia succiniciproducens]
MDSLQSLQQQLIQQMDAYQPCKNQPEITALTAKIQLEQNLLAWLKAQQDYPQFYLHCRADSPNEQENHIATIGQVRTFTTVNHAQTFVRRADFTLVGGMTFNGECDFYLPRLLLRQVDGELTATLFIDSQKDLSVEKQLAGKCLKNFTKSVALEPVVQSVQLVEKKATQAQWCEWVEQALLEIKKGSFTKVVLANESIFSSRQPINAIDFLAESEKKNTGCYHFFFAQKADCAFIGSSPERLYLRNGQDLQTEALAGTAVMSDDEEQNQRQGEWLLKDEKNEYENMLVVEDICGNIESFTQNIEVQSVELKRLRLVQHLRRKIFAKLTALAADEACLNAIHPTAAVAGLPKQNALRFLAKTETFERSWYAGTLGFMNRARAEFCVTLRSAFVEQNRIRVFAGAGIVAGSVPLLEWQEIERKASGLLSLLQNSGEHICQ